MNAIHAQSRRAVTVRAYPNAADRRYFLDRLADGILSAAICVGVVTVLFFLITLR